MKLVSAIMPTRGRREFAARAVECFLSQTYKNRELIILDDADDPSFPANAFQRNRDRDRVSYFRMSERFSIPAKRNHAARLSSGDIVMHFDSDDWSDSRRIADQVQRLEESGKPVVGYHSMLFYRDDPAGAFWYRGYPLHAIGTSLAYTREWWSAHPFRPGPNNENIGEDTQFSKEARDSDAIQTVEARPMMVARIHAGNTSVKNITCASVEYRPVPIETIPAGFFG